MIILCDMDKQDIVLVLQCRENIQQYAWLQCENTLLLVIQVYKVVWYLYFHFFKGSVCGYISWIYRYSGCLLCMCIDGHILKWCATLLYNSAVNTTNRHSSVYWHYTDMLNIIPVTHWMYVIPAAQGSQDSALGYCRWINTVTRDTCLWKYIYVCLLHLSRYNNVFYTVDVS